MIPVQVSKITGKYFISNLPPRFTTATFKVTQGVVRKGGRRDRHRGEVLVAMTMVTELTGNHY